MIDAILSRRSIRQYTAEPVSEEQIETLLRAAMAAPSAGNQQPWQFVIIRDRALLDAVPTFHPYSAMIRQAPLAILVCGDLRGAGHPAFWVQDCSAATENLLLAAHALGLGAVWLGVYPAEETVQAMRRLLGLPEEIVPLALVPVGHPAEHKPPAERYDPARVHYDGW